MAFVWPTTAFPGLSMSAVMPFLMNTQLKLCISLGPVLNGKLWPQNFLHGGISTTPWGAIDGKHVTIRCPRNGGSLYYNYKGLHSIILFALMNTNYKFIWVDVGINRSSSDAQIFNQS